MGKNFAILFTSCWLLRLNPGARGELLTSQLSWVAAWILVTRVFPVYVVKDCCYIRGVYKSLVGGGGGGGEVSWAEKGEWWVGRVGKVCEWSGVAMVGKMCEWSEVAQWERWKNGEVARSERWEPEEVAIWERQEGSEQRRWDGISGKNCVVLLQGSEM